MNWVFEREKYDDFFNFLNNIQINQNISVNWSLIRFLFFFGELMSANKSWQI